ncbi:sugar transferase [Mesorhizobium muleiense]|uniref:Sugar transferase involved in LPS biosynthesis (Colanic, teichoic acid) n=1 Tax=Mesorhizobium muleiense TaxID=1004279 RepID=A0A1G8L3U1_9HYPH|nr:sugar transferase [Mesorhizobium muleiense]MCF6100424.1 sugar transferase [Mesorhizobium muleiense]SDI50305.1 Sugar transferase involved in LPS biosynthesis (colanic, teichoic acid) [Mesorhizobium muleiense]
MSSTQSRSNNERLARLFDIGFAALGLIVLSPVIAIASIAILVETGRPILFSQSRLGRNGRPFAMLKLRKFRPDASDCHLPLTMMADERMSRFGRVLAITKLDELPQLINILRGEMAVVGPRPESLELAYCFTNSSLPLLAYKPGIFGPSQWVFRNESALFPLNVDPVEFYRQILFPLKARIDLSYYAERTLTTDMKWVVLCSLAVAGLRIDTKLAATHL